MTNKVNDQQPYNEQDPRMDPAVFSEQHVFKAPDGYFDQLSANIADKIHAGHTGTVTFWRPSRVIALATVALLVLGGGWFYFENMKSEKSQATVLTYDDMVGSGLVYEFDESMLQEVYVDAAPKNSLNTASDEKYQDYLMENNTDITLIINEL